MKKKAKLNLRAQKLTFALNSAIHHIKVIVIKLALMLMIIIEFSPNSKPMLAQLAQLPELA